jgi:hypothetical protein
MNTLINIAQRFIYVKDISTALNWSLIEKQYESTNWNHNVENHISANYDFFDRDILVVEKSMLESEVRHYLNASMGLKGYYENIKITESWANLTEPGQGHHDHMHPFSVVSGTLFLDDNPDNLNLFIETHTPDLPFFLPKNKTYVDLKTLLPDIGVDPAQTNNLKHHLVLFLSNWHHNVAPVPEGNPNRRTIAFNTMWSGRVGTGQNLAGMVFP